MADEARTIYFHGMPGSGDELRLFGDETAAKTAGFHVPDRSGRGCLVPRCEYFGGIASSLAAQFPHARLHLIGFSLGASAALLVAAHLGERVARIDLVSGAAPLQTGGFLDAMAGASVFKLAKTRPRAFALFAQAQYAASRLVPGRLYAMLFASARGADHELARDPVFRAAMSRMLGAGLGQGMSGYRREIELYVDDWSDELDRVTQPITIWHGREDNWSPVGMAEVFAQRLRGCEGVHLIDGLSHYSTLRHFLAHR